MRIGMDPHKEYRHQMHVSRISTFSCVYLRINNPEYSL